MLSPWMLTNCLRIMMPSGASTAVAAKIVREMLLALMQ